MPGLVVLPLLALLLALGLAALVSLKPWEDTRLGADVELAPDLGVSLEEAVPLPSLPEVEVARASVAAEPVLAAARTSPAAPGRTQPGPSIGVAQNEVVVAAQPAEPPSRPLAPPQIAPPPAPATVPAAVPVVAPPAAPGTQIIADLDPPGAWRSVVDGDATPPGVAAVQIREGDRYALSFEFFIERMAYGEPGADNRILQLTSDGAAAPAFGLQLWDDLETDPAGGLRGLWASGEEMGGDRFLTAVSERAWHTASVHFEASSQGAGFYEIHLDGVLVDARSGVSLIVPGSEYGRLELGIFRDAEVVNGSAEVRFRSVRLGDSPESVQP